MLTVNGNYLNAVIPGKRNDNFAAGYKCFLVGKKYSLFSLYGVNRGHKTDISDNGSERHICVLVARYFAERVLTGYNLGISIGKSRFKVGILCLIANADGMGFKLSCLHFEQSNIGIGGECNDVDTAVRRGNVKSLCAY